MQEAEQRWLHELEQAEQEWSEQRAGTADGKDCVGSFTLRKSDTLAFT